jgi:rhodanese-related sulfurtransferase
VDVNFVKPYAVLPKLDGVTIIDARPAARKYDVGHIPTAVNIPDSQFDKLAPALLPKDKSQLVIFYCDGPECMLSHNSAFKAEKLGYTNIRVYSDGFPDWIKNGNLAAVSVAPVKQADAAPAIVAGKEAGTIEVSSFERIFKEAPGTVYFVDVREPQEFASGTFKGAINMPINTLEKNIARLPADKPIVFFCGAGGRSGEAHDMVKMYRPELKTVFLDATIKWTAAGEYTIAGK